MAIVNYELQAEATLRNLYKNCNITDKNKSDLKRYISALEVTPARIGIIARHISLLFKVLPDVVGSMNDRDLVNRTFKGLKRSLKPGYFETIKNVSKAFVRWHNNNQTPEGYLDIKSNAKTAQKRDLKPEDMITWEDGLKLAETTNSIQIKAAILTQLDGGFRPSEFIDLNYSDIQIKGNFGIARVSANHKTGKRDVILFKCVPYLQRWLKNHPSKLKESPLWIMEYGNKSRRDNNKGIIRYDYWALVKRVRELGKKIDFQKPMDFYNLRHSACYLSKMDNINPELAARKFGHSVNYYTDTYARLSPDDDINRYKKSYGIAKSQKDNEPKPIFCDRCGTVNEPGIELCEQCASPLTLEAARVNYEDLRKIKQYIAIFRDAGFDLERLKRIVSHNDTSDNY